MRLHTLYAVAALIVAVAAAVVLLLREDCAALPSDLDRALCQEK
jgi:hypothetical protein